MFIAPAPTYLGAYGEVLLLVSDAINISLLAE